MSNLPEPVRRTVDWWFRDRSTGKLVVGQFPNWPLWLWPGTVLTVVRTGAIVIWAVMEIGWGVNPWRRLLGTIVLVWQVVGVLGRLG